MVRSCTYVRVGNGYNSMKKKGKNFRGYKKKRNEEVFITNKIVISDDTFLKYLS